MTTPPPSKNLTGHPHHPHHLIHSTPPPSIAKRPGTAEPCTLFAKTEPHRSFSSFLTQNPPPPTHHSLSDPHLLNLALPHHNQLPVTRIQCPLHFVHENRAPASCFRVFDPKPTSIAYC